MPKKKKSSKGKKVVKRRTKIKKKSSKGNKVVKRRTKIKKVAKESSSQELVFKTRPEWIKSGLVNKSQYQNKYNESIKNNNVFWKKEGKRITWIKPYKKIKDIKYSKEDVRIKWY